MRYLDDIAVGEVHELRPRTISRESIIAFAREFDRHPVHLDEEAALASQFRGLIASGLHTLSLTASAITDDYLGDIAFVAGAGMAHVQWPRPVRPGDSLAVRIEVLSKGDHPKSTMLGVLRVGLTVTNQSAAVVMTASVDYLITKQA